MTAAKSPRAKGYIVVEESKCKACELCIHFCPQKNLALAATINNRGFHPAKMTDEDKCTACGICALMCPDACIKIFRK